MRDIRKEPDLAELSRDLYPELDRRDLRADAAGPYPRALKAELHAVGQMLQIMEDAWLNLGLKGHYDLPMERGWMNVFRRWTSTRASSTGSGRRFTRSSAPTSSSSAIRNCT